MSDEKKVKIYEGKQVFIVAATIIMLIVFFVWLYKNISFDDRKNLDAYLHKYIPYTIESTPNINIYKIRDLESGKIIYKGSKGEVFKEIDRLEVKWGKEHLFVRDGELSVLYDDGQLRDKRLIWNREEREYLKNFYGI